MDSTTIKIGEFARLTGCSVRTLRFYEELGLLQPEARTKGNFRLYRTDQVARVAAIRRLQDLGLPLGAIGEVLAAGSEVGAQRVEPLVRSIDEQITLVRERLQKLGAELDDLEAARRRLVEQCASCHLPMRREHCDPCSRTGEPLDAVLRALLG